MFTCPTREANAIWCGRARWVLPLGAARDGLGRELGTWQGPSRARERLVRTNGLGSPSGRAAWHYNHVLRNQNRMHRMLLSCVQPNPGPQYGSRALPVSRNHSCKRPGGMWLQAGRRRGLAPLARAGLRCFSTLAENQQAWEQQAIKEAKGKTKDPMKTFGSLNHDVSLILSLGCWKSMRPRHPGDSAR